MLGKIHSLTLVAGVPQKLPGGRYLRVIGMTYPVTLTFFDESNQDIGEWIGVLSGFSIDASDFASKLGLVSAIFGSVNIVSATSQSATIAVSRVPVGYDYIQGTLTLTGPGDALPSAARSKGGSSYGGGITLTSGATTYPFIQLRNASAAMNVIVQNAVCSSPNASHNIITGFNPAAATTIGTRQNSKKIIPAGSMSVNALIETDIPLSLPASLSRMFERNSGVDISWDILSGDPITLAPGVAFYVLGILLNSTLQANFEWYEEAV